MDAATVSSAHLGRIIVQKGFPGAGKFTIRRRATELLPLDTTRFLNSRLLIDAVAAVNTRPKRRALRAASPGPRASLRQAQGMRTGGLRRPHQHMLSRG